MGRLLKRREKDSQSELSSPDVGCVGFVGFFFFSGGGARVKNEI